MSVRRVNDRSPERRRHHHRSACTAGCISMTSATTVTRARMRFFSSVRRVELRQKRRSRQARRGRWPRISAKGMRIHANRICHSTEQQTKANSGRESRESLRTILDIRVYPADQPHLPLLPERNERAPLGRMIDRACCTDKDRAREETKPCSHARTSTTGRTRNRYKCAR